MNVSIVSLVCFLFLILSACDRDNTNISQTNQAPLVRTAKIVSLKQNNIGLKRTYPGILEASKKADLSFRVSGQLLRLNAVPGQRVKLGDLLAQIDPTDFNNSHAERTSRFKLAKTKRDQTRQLLKKKLSSQLNFDQANAEFQSTQAALQQAKDNLRYTSLKAPFDGVIARVNIEIYQPVQAQVAIIHLRSDDQFAIRFSVPESILSKLKQVKDPSTINNFCGEVNFSHHPDRTFTACYKEHESIPDPLTRNYSALFMIENISDFVILPGMTAIITLDFYKYLANQVNNSIYAPIESVFAQAGKKWLWQIDSEMKAHKFQVQVGKIEGKYIEIISQINPKVKIIAAGVSYVREGMKVKPIVKQRGL